MGLLDDIKAEVSGARGPRCPVALALDELDAADAADLEEALTSGSGATHAAIGRVLRARGLHAPDGGIASHRNGKCGCKRDN